ncbi:MAG: hypothetical protein PHE89_08175, partial [Alphaproteobacteria bacterium]|nr:hypothetical protein [Alphaproteobacteria bacterium]
KSNFVKCENGGATGADSCTDSEGEKFSSCKQLTCFDGGYHITTQTNMDCSKITYKSNTCYECYPSCTKLGYLKTYNTRYSYETVFLDDDVICYKDCTSEISRLYPGQYIMGRSTSTQIGYVMYNNPASVDSFSTAGLSQRQISNKSFTEIPLCEQTEKPLLKIQPQYLSKSDDYDAVQYPSASLEDLNIQHHTSLLYYRRGIYPDSLVYLKKTDDIAAFIPEADDMITRHKVSNFKNISLEYRRQSAGRTSGILIPGSHILTIEGENNIVVYYKTVNAYNVTIDYTSKYSILLPGNKVAGEYTGQNVYSVLYIKPGATLTVDQPICVDTAAGGRIINEGTINGTIIENCTDYE